VGGELLLAEGAGEEAALVFVSFEPDEVGARQLQLGELQGGS
jgi:hypothetical protein